MKTIIKALNVALLGLVIVIAYKGYKDYKALVSMPEIEVIMFFPR
jgi:hypothetical protein